MTLKLGILGGAFDPIHEGHIHIARLAYQKLALDRVYFLPLNQAVHKNQPHYSGEQRAELIRKAIKPYNYMYICLYDLERGGPSYAVDTIRELKNHADFTGQDLYYIIGTDAFEQFFAWKDPYSLLDLVKFIVAARPGYDFARIERMFAGAETYLDRLFLIEDAGLDVSSTRIREQAENAGEL
ncbi:MAG: nicotinate (nicotinamide) nucleotide adenylyltransferase [Candidatus Margulisbacteria bacterium]|jgi:nicotinate-nucleotide adenylyltransferase|nr:nicotinate (nicotinamide) nucleotide adenylyltransferase [Candidatus Margulisiibacteriota bacterium]